MVKKPLNQQSTLLARCPALVEDTRFCKEYPKRLAE